MSLSTRQRQRLKGLAHGLSVSVQVGASGLTPGVVDSVDEALAAHELIKVKVGQGSDVDRKAGAAELAELSGSDLVGVIGRVWILYRPDPEAPRIDVG